MLKGKITDKGFLQIERVGKNTQMSCIRDLHRRCGDYCVGFGDTIAQTSGIKRYLALPLCHGMTLFFESLKDERFVSESEQLSLFQENKCSKSSLRPRRKS